MKKSNANHYFPESSMYKLLPRYVLLVLILAFGGIAGCDMQDFAGGNDGLNKPSPVTSSSAPYSGDGTLQWYKGQLHTHSYWSDANDYPEMIMDWYKSEGYHFAMISEHNTLPEGEKWIEVEKGSQDEKIFNEYLNTYGESWVEYEDKGSFYRVRLKTLDEYRSRVEEPGSFLTMNTQEIDYREGNLLLHMNVTNIRELIMPPSGGTVPEILQRNIDRVREQSQRLNVPMMVQVNHPNINGSITAEDLKQVDDARFFEVYNGHPNATNSGGSRYQSTEEIWDEVNTDYLLNGKPLMYGLAVDDAHHYNITFNNPGRGWVQVRSDKLTPEALIAAMKEGNFYSSTGVRLSTVRFKDNTLSLSIDAESGVQYTTKFIGTMKDNPENPGVVLAEQQGTEASYTLTGNELYVRAKVVSDKDKRYSSEQGEVEVAWVQPVQPEGHMGSPTAIKQIYDEALVSPWINASWSSSIDFNSSEQAFAGSKSVKVAQRAWGALSLHSGKWGESEDVNPNNYEDLEFAIYADNQQATIKVQFQNDSGESFPRVSYGTVPANQWTSAKIPMEKLNPNNQIIHRLTIYEVSGNSKTYFVDELKLSAPGDASSPAPPSTPTLESPADESTGLSTSPTLNWNGDTPSYHLQVAEDASFTRFAVDKSGITSSSYTPSGLVKGETYYWRVKGVSQNGTESSWSSDWSFRTQEPEVTVDEIYTDMLKSPWINASWKASVDFNNVEVVHSGDKAVKVAQQAWGALSVHSGKWWQTYDIDPSQYEAVEFAVYAVDSSSSFSVMLENDQGESFPRVSYGEVPAGQWTVIRIPMEKLNPNNNIIHRVDILERSGSAKTYYVDAIQWIEKSQPS